MLSKALFRSCMGGTELLMFLEVSNVFFNFLFLKCAV